MTYIDLVNAFNQWLEHNYLPSLAQLLWFKLIDIFNRAGWCEWVSVDNLRLMSMLQIKREATFIEYRNKLVEEKFFEFKKGKKGCPNQYKILYFQFESPNSSQNRSQKRNKTVVKSEVKTVDIYRLRLDKDKDKDINSCCSNNNYYSAELKNESEEIQQQLQQLFISCTNSTNLNAISECISYLDDLPYEVIEIALKKTSEKNGGWKYAKAILNNWLSAGIKTVEQVQAEELNYRQLKSSKQETEEEEIARRANELKEAIENDTEGFY